VVYLTTLSVTETKKTSNHRMSNEKGIGKDIEGCDDGII
jgi:hypothetical protein